MEEDINIQSHGQLGDDEPHSAQENEPIPGSSDQSHAESDFKDSDQGDTHGPSVLKPTTFDEADIKRLQRELEHQELFPVASTLSQVYQHGLDDDIRERLKTSMNVHAQQIEVICTTRYATLFNSLNQLRHGTHKIQSLSNRSKSINRDLKLLVTDRAQLTSQLTKLVRQRENLQATAKGLSLTLPILAEFSRVVDYTEEKRQYFALTIILKIEQQISELPDKLQKIDYVEKIGKQLPTYKENLKTSCHDEILTWLEQVHGRTMLLRNFEETREAVNAYDDTNLLPLYRAKRVYETLQELPSFTSWFQQRRNDQRRHIISLGLETPEEESPEHTEEYLARVSGFFFIERLISRTVPAFSSPSTLERYYRESVHFGILPKLKVSLIELDRVDNVELGPDTRVKQLEYLYIACMNFINFERDQIPDEIISDLQDINEEIQGKCLDGVLSATKQQLVEIFANDSYTPLGPVDLENPADHIDPKILQLISILKSDDTGVWDDADLEFLNCSEMVAKIVFCVLEFMETIRTQRTRQIPANLEFLIEASKLVFNRKGLQMSFHSHWMNAGEEGHCSFEKCKIIILNMSYLEKYAPIVLRQEFFKRHFDATLHRATLPVKKWQDAIHDVAFHASQEIDAQFKTKIDELSFEDRISDFIDARMREIELHCSSDVIEQRYNYIGRSLSDKFLDELVGSIEDRADGMPLTSRLSSDDLDDMQQHIEGMKVWLDMKNAKIGKAEYLFSEYLQRPLQLIELGLNRNDDWFHFVQSYGKDHSRFRQVQQDLASILYSRTLAYEVGQTNIVSATTQNLFNSVAFSLTGDNRMVNDGDSSRDRIDFIKRIGEQIKQLS